MFSGGLPQFRQGSKASTKACVTHFCFAQSPLEIKELDIEVAKLLFAFVLRVIIRMWM